MISEKWVTLEEMERFWSIDDVLEANEVLNALHEAQHREHKKQAAAAKAAQPRR